MLASFSVHRCRLRQIDFRLLDCLVGPCWLATSTENEYQTDKHAHDKAFCNWESDTQQKSAGEKVEICLKVLIEEVDLRYLKEVYACHEKNVPVHNWQRY
mgnify:CR=1 FL=1